MFDYSFTDDLRGQEGAKIEWGKAHFEALAVGSNPAHCYTVARSIDDLRDRARTSAS